MARNRRGRPARPWWRADRGAWFATVGGRQVRLGLTYEAALEALRSLLGGPRQEVGGKTLECVIGAYLDDLAARVGRREASPTSLGVRSRQLRHLGELAARPAEGISHAEAEAWLAWRGGCQVSRSGYSQNLKAATAWAARRGLIARDPLAGWRVPRGRPRRRTIPAEAELAAILEHARPDAREVFGFLADTGCRPGEARTIEARHLRGDVVELDEWKCSRSGRLRTIYLAGAWPGRLADLAGVHPSGPLFRRARGGGWPLTDLSVAWRRACRRAGVSGVVLYSLRHRSITRDLLAGESLAVVAALHGTSAREIERTYSHVTSQAEALRAAVRRRAG